MSIATTIHQSIEQTFISSMLSSPYEPAVCQPAYNPTALVLSSVLIVGLVGSYLPQHARIINTRSSEGLSPWYLLLGSTSSASGFFNIFILGWGLINCCKILSIGTCTSSILGIIQVFLQWILFSFNFVLFLYYFPDHLKYGSVPESSSEPIRKGRTSRLWRISVALAGLTVLYSVVVLGVVLYLLNYYPLPQPTPVQPPHKVLGRLADIMGILSTILAVAQYAPQIHLTWQEGFVGALSIPTMLIQTPGCVMFVMSIAIREGTTWSSWFPFAITGVLQGVLLVMCICWKKRQARLNIDDFGRPLGSDGSGVVATNGEDERTPLLRS